MGRGGLQYHLEWTRVEVHLQNQAAQIRKAPKALEVHLQNLATQTRKVPKALEVHRQNQATQTRKVPKAMTVSEILDLYIQTQTHRLRLLDVVQGCGVLHP